MKKQYMYFIFTLVLVLSSFIPVSNGFTLKETPHLLESEKYIPKKTQTINKTKISYHVGKESIEETENYNKISKYVLEKIQKVGLDTPIAVTVGISYKYNLQNFLSNLSLVEKEIAKITSAYTFDTNLTGQQIQLLAQNKEVLWISLSSEIVTIDESINSMKDEDSIIVPFLNASTEMTGTKKARKDFGVTGNRDGSETTYSLNDVVIAVVDTGIDDEHIDLDGGKVIGWYDLISQESNPYDDNGHGTHVASIAAGTGEGDPGIEEGYAPGAALVGVKVLGANGTGSIQNIANGINWVVDHNDTLGVEILNLSIGAYGVDETPVCEAITNAVNNGIIVTIAAGNFNSAPYAQYDSLSDFAHCNGVVVGNMVDPYEGGWSPNKSSRRGTAKGTIVTGPDLIAPGTNIRAAAANTTDGYTTMTGTSMSAPAVAGILALMNDASNGSLIYTIYTEDFGKSGFDPVYGNGEILAYDSIKEAKGAFSGSFDDFRDHLIGQTSIDEGFIHTYTINVYHTDTNLYFATTLLMLDEDGDDFDLYVWGPGKDPHTDAPDYSSIGTDPQEVISFKPTSTGNYTVGIYAYSGSGQYSVDFIGQIRPEG